MNSYVVGSPIERWIATRSPWSSETLIKLFVVNSMFRYPQFVLFSSRFLIEVFQLPFITVLQMCEWNCRSRVVFIYSGFGDILVCRGVCTQAPCYCIVMEYCPYGQLYDVLRDGKQLPPSLLCDWAKQMTNGMMYLHAHKIIHRDLKSPKLVFVSLFRITLCLFFGCWPLCSFENSAA